MRQTRRHSEAGRIDGGEGRGVRLGGSDTAAPRPGTSRRPRAGDGFDDDETLIEEPNRLDDYEEFSGDENATPDDRRRDPLRKPGS